MYSSEFELIKNIALETGEFLKHQKNKKIVHQNNKDIKLELDIISEQKITAILIKNFDYPILCEESGEVIPIKANYPYWIIDPIDGTMNFSKNCPLSCISIALFIGTEPILGIVYDFNRNELFSAIVGKGAWLNDKELMLSNIIRKSQAILATGFPIYLSHDKETLTNYIQIIQEYKKIRMIGSAALSLAYVASGRFDTYIENNIKLWDIAAGWAINKALGNHIQVQWHSDNLLDIKIGVFS